MVPEGCDSGRGLTRPNAVPLQSPQNLEKKSKAATVQETPRRGAAMSSTQDPALLAFSKSQSDRVAGPNAAFLPAPWCSHLRT